MEIKRNYYLQKLIDSQDNGMIKIITGIRRCGKSYILFKMFKDYLLSTGVKEENIITLALDDDTNTKYRNCKNLSKYIRQKIKDKKKKYFVFLDEIQFAITRDELKKIYDEPIELYSVLNGLLHLDNVDVYITGSNSKLLSKDVMTEFRGRGDEIRIYPLNFAEFYSINKVYTDKIFDDYCTYGGLPSVVLESNIKKKINYLNYQATNIYLNDVVERNNIKNKEILSTLVEIISSNIGSLTNPKKLVNTFKGKKVPISDKSISKYLDCLENAFLIQKTKRYDIKGRHYIGTPVKYYFTDIGVRNSLINFRQDEKDHILENIIYNELKIREYSVDIGVVEHKTESTSKQFEIDFVCNYASKRYYIQTAYGIPSAEKLKQETNSLTKIKDYFKKIIIVKEDVNRWQNNDGILIMGIKEFLLNPNSLEL